MSWHWKNLASCDLDELMDDVNPQMKDLENNLGKARPSCMDGYPDAVGAIVKNTVVTVGATTDETTVKTAAFGRGAFGTKGGFKFRAGGNCTGSGGVKTIKIKFGGILFGTLSVSTGTRSWLIEGEVWNIDATNQQRWHVKCWDGQSPGIESMNVSNDSSLSVETN